MYICTHDEQLGAEEGMARSAPCRYEYVYIYKYVDLNMISTIN